MRIRDLFSRAAYFLALLMAASAIAEPGGSGTTSNPQRVFLGFNIRYEVTAGGGRIEVLRVVPDSSAAKAGIRDGDWILSFGGRRHMAKSLSELIESQGWIVPGQPLEVVLSRDGKEMSLVMVPDLATPDQQASILRYLEECRRLPEGCNDLCESEDIEVPFKLRDLVSSQGMVTLVFGKDPSGELILLKTEPAPPKNWNFRLDPTFASGEILESVRALLKQQNEVTVVYQKQEPGKFSISLKV